MRAAVFFVVLLDLLVNELAISLLFHFGCGDPSGLFLSANPDVLSIVDRTAIFEPLNPNPAVFAHPDSSPVRDVYAWILNIEDLLAEVRAFVLPVVLLVVHRYLAYFEHRLFPPEHTGRAHSKKVLLGTKFSQHFSQNVCFSLEICVRLEYPVL